MAHSKAPWKIETETAHEWKDNAYVPYTKKTGWIDAADGTPVMQYAGCGSHEAEIANPDDEALILAAPELLAALKEMVKSDEVNHPQWQGSPAQKQALAAIAKAEGGAK